VFFAYTQEKHKKFTFCSFSVRTLQFI